MGQLFSGPEASRDEGPVPRPPEMNKNAAPEGRAVEELEIQQLEKDAQRLNDLVTGSGVFVVIRDAGGEWADKNYGSRHAREEQVNVRCYGLDSNPIGNNEYLELFHRNVFPHPFIRFVSGPAGPHGALPDHVVLSSTSAARNGEFFDVFDVCAAIEESMNLWHEGSPRASCDKCLTSIELFTDDPATIWDLTPPERDPVPDMPRMVQCREKVFAFAMGLHPRLGAQAGMHVLDPESLRRIGEIVLSAEAEVTRASIPIFCTTWRKRTTWREEN
ncbi:hypothetical protein T484DRAFT_1898535 [Baffinella frigidus]|nr:hypothetical protein T484DRAFT_1898535 [Cryptophyta sp. CCMP2293]